MTLILRLVRIALPYYRWILAGVLMALLTLVANVGLLALSGWFIASMALTGLTGADFNYHYPAAGIRALAILRTVGRYVERIVSHEASLRILSGLRVWIYRKIEPLAPAGLEGYESGDLLSRIRADIDTLDSFYLRMMAPLLTATAATIVFIAFIWNYSPSIACSTLILLMLSGIFLPLMVFGLGKSSGASITATSAELRTTVVDTLRGLDEVLVYGADHAACKKMERVGHELQKAQRRQSGLSGVSSAGVTLCAGLSLWFGLLAAIPLIKSRVIAGADLVMLTLLCQACFETVAPLPDAFRQLGQVLSAAGRIFSLADGVPAVHEPVVSAQLSSLTEITFRDVCCEYRQGVRVLQNITLDLMPGRKIALVGASGAGKSSVISLLLRFREYQAGSIRLNGRELREYGGEELRRLMAVAPQKAFLFNATIRENLLIARPDANNEELEQAARLAGMYEEILARPEGFDTPVGESGMKLSGGEARRLSLARALLKDAPLLILDEPLEGLDAASGREIFERICRHAEEGALLMISHSRVGLELMDEVLLLEQGKIVGRGRHDELMERSECYRELFRIL